MPIAVAWPATVGRGRQASRRRTTLAAINVLADAVQWIVRGLLAGWRSTRCFPAAGIANDRVVGQHIGAARCRTVAHQVAFRIQLRHVASQSTLRALAPALACQ